MKNWIVGNWKMNGSQDAVTDYVPALLNGLAEFTGWEKSARVVLCPPYPYLGMLARALIGYPIAVGAQNVSAQPQGALTGEVSPHMLADLGVTVCIIGHSERRRQFAESDDFIGEKLRALLEIGLTPILCVGETLAERDAAGHMDVVRRQVLRATEDVSAEALARAIIAYEPVWAIGTGVNATPEQANEMHAFIRNLLDERFGAETAGRVPILYGGSVNPANAGALMSQPEINGSLVGGASLKSETFLPIIEHSLT